MVRFVVGETSFRIIGFEWILGRRVSIGARRGHATEYVLPQKEGTWRFGGRMRRKPLPYLVCVKLYRVSAFSTLLLY